MAAALARTGITFVQQENPVEAIRYLNGALKTIHYQGFPVLKGYILQALSETYAMAQQPQACWQTIGQLEHVLEQGERVQERSNTRFNAASYTAQKGINTLLLHDYRRALALMEKSLQTYDPALIRGRARLLAQKAEAYYGLGEVDASVMIAEEAFMLAHSVGASKTHARVLQLHAAFLQSPWRKERSTARLGALLSL